MKRFLFFVLFSIITFTAFSQMSGDYNYSIAVRGFTVMQMPKILNETNSDRFTNAYFSGVMVKFNDNQFSYRINGTYYNRSKTFFNNCEACEEANGKLTDYSFKIGFEKSFNYSRLQPYLGFDLGYRSNRFMGDLKNRNLLKESAAITSIATIEATKSGLVLSPVLGIKINPIEQISLFAEGNIDFFYSYERQETTSQDVNNTRVLNKYTKTEILLSPVSIGIQIHLGSTR